MTNRPERPDFGLTAQNQQPPHAQKSLAEAVLGVTDRTNYNQAIRQTQLALMGPGPYEEFSQQERNELNISSAIIEDMLAGGRIRFANVLTDWPTYHRLMRHGAKQDGSGAALLIGSLTPLSSRAFHTLAPNEFGIDKTLVVDPQGSKFKTRQGLVRASGLELPLAPESMDFVVTNQLLHNLYDPRSEQQSFKANSTKLFSEIGRVLKPGGQLLMQEVPPGINDDWNERKHVRYAKKLARVIERRMQDNGITNTAMEMQEAFANSDYLFDPTRDFESHERYKRIALTLHGTRNSEAITQPLQ